MQVSMKPGYIQNPTNNKMKRILYFGYYLKQTDREKFFRFLNYAARESGKSKLLLLLDLVFSTFRYNISLLDYFYFRFYNKPAGERRLWAGSGYMYEYHLIMNPKNSRDILENKIKFLDKYHEFVKRCHYTLPELKGNKSLGRELLSNASGKIVLKLSTGQVGAEVKVYKSDQFTPETLINEMERLGFDLAEEYVIQHQSLMEISPTGLNTLRVFTQLEGDEVVFLGARLRVSVNSPVDNMGAGNLAASVNMETGVVDGPGVYSDITKSDETVHPVTGISIVGFQVPFWKEITAFVTQAAKHHPENKSIGWDIAITPSGPELIEGNHNWCKLLWQLPVKRGLKPMISKYH